MKLFWMIVAGICIAVAAVFLALRDFNTAFVVAALGMIAWFLNYRAQMREIIGRANLEDNKGDDEDDDEI